MGVTLVLDASAGIDLLLDTETGRRLQGLLPAGATWWVPEHYFVEVASVLRRTELHGAITEALALSAFTVLDSASVLRTQVQPLLAEAWQMRHNLTIADAVYVALAKNLGAALVTTDLKLAAAVAGQIQTISA